MPETVAHTFTVERLQILDELSECNEELCPPLTSGQMRQLYEWMVLARVADERACKLQREGRLRTYASLRGQEAAQVGSAFALRPSDWMFPSYREAAVFIVRGLPLRMIYQYWSGDERGSQIPANQNDVPVSIPVATQLPIAVGAAWAAKANGDPIAVLTYFGDGATSKGDFHEALNIAGSFSLPIVFLCQNNQWAISVPLKRQTGAQSLAQKAIAYGFTGIQADGNDVFGVYKAATEALEKARGGRGPTLIECVTYRMGDHTTADDASRYRSEEEVQRWEKYDPIERLRKYMAMRNLWDEAYEKKVMAEARKRVNEAVREEEAIATPDPRDIFRYTFRDMPPELATQMDALLEDSDSGTQALSGERLDGHLHTH